MGAVVKLVLLGTRDSSKLQGGEIPSGRILTFPSLSIDFLCSAVFTMNNYSVVSTMTLWCQQQMKSEYLGNWLSFRNNIEDGELGIGGHRH
jgi:hypothetical protein